MDYPHRIILAAPEELWGDANALALVIGEQPGDDKTFIATNAVGPGRHPFCYIECAVRPGVVEALTGIEALQAPAHAPDADLSAAARAIEAIRLTGPCAPGFISLRVDADFDEALTALGLTPVAPPAFVQEQDSIRLAQLYEQIKAERDRRLNADFLFQDTLFQRDPISVQRIAGAAQLAALAIMGGAQAGDVHWHGGDEAFGWIASNDTVVTMDAFTVINFGRAAAARETQLIFAARYLRMLDPVPEDFADDRWWP